MIALILILLIVLVQKSRPASRPSISISSFLPSAPETLKKLRVRTARHSFFLPSSFFLPACRQAWLSSFFLLLPSCSTDDFIPKPKGYFRIDLPPRQYQEYERDCPFTFEFHREAEIKANKDKNSEPCWINIEYPRQKATIHISYKKIEKDSAEKQIGHFIEDSRSLVYKHTVKATDIIEDRIEDDSSKVFGLLYSLEGNAASSMQFYLTDSVNHFVRGALYFNVTTNADSLAPVIRYIQDDILHLVNTFEWKKN